MTYGLAFLLDGSRVQVKKNSHCVPYALRSDKFLFAGSSIANQRKVIALIKAN